MRSFLSYDVEEPALLSKIRDFQKKLLSTGADLKIVKPEQLHFTIRFLGEIDETQKAEVIKSLEGSLQRLDLEMRFQGVGAFPSEKRISVIWIGCDEESAEKLGEQAALVNKILENNSSFRRDPNERFSPHVTISRVRTGRNKDELVKFLQEHSRDDFGTARIKSLKLKLSTLAPFGPTYDDIHIFS